MSQQISQQMPSFGILVRTQHPYILLNSKADLVHTLRIKYLSTNTGLDSSGITEQASLDAPDELPNLPSDYHELLVTLMIAKVAEDLQGLTNEDGKPLFPGLRATAELMRGRYERDLAAFKNRATQKRIDLIQRPFEFASGEIDRMISR